MSDKFKNSKFYLAMKNPKVSRAIYIGLVVLLVAVAVVVGLTAAANRKKGEVKDPPSQVTTQRPADTTKVPDNTGTTAPDNSVALPNDEETPVVSTVPTLSLPVSGVLGRTHDAKVQVFSPTMNDYRVHLGVDIATEPDSPVYSAADGKIQKIWKDPLMGYSVAIEHSGNAVTIYKNLSETLADGIFEGANVKAGRQIGTVGESAMIEIADEPHLHLEMTVGGLQVDPLEYFSASDLKKLEKDTAYEG